MPLAAHDTGLKDVLRIEAVNDLGIMNDGSSQEAYDRIARFARELFNIPIALITFMDGETQWFKSHLGTDETSRAASESFCKVPVTTGKSLLVEDATQDSRFNTLSLVTGKENVRFYAGAPVTTHDGQTIGTVCVLDVVARSFTPRQMQMLEDLAAMVMAQVKIDRNIGRVDPLTRLPNRIQFLLGLQDLVRANPSAKCWIVLIDLLDHHSADDVIGVLGIDFYHEQIRYAAAILRQRLPGETIYHVGGAYLALIIEDDGAVPDALIHQLDADLREPLVTSRGIPAALSPCFGIRQASLAEMATPDVLRTVISASRHARQSETLYAVYSEPRDAEQKRLFSLLSDLPKALRSQKQLHLVYQPRIEVATGRCVAAEALLRWNHPQWGPVSPAEFFPLAEKTGLIHEVTDWVMRNAAKQAAIWRRKGVDLICAFNISSKNLLEDDLVTRLDDVLRATGVNPEMMEVEVVEDMNLDNSAVAFDRLRDLRKLGVGVAIDDFGSGYSNMAYLLSLPASSLKIDRSLISKALTDAKALVALPTIIKLGHDLGFQMVAEGVETEEMHDLLRQWKCDEVQGFLFARPMEPDALEAWLANRKTQQPVPV